MDHRVKAVRQGLDWRAKGLPAIDGAMTVEAVREAGWNLFDGRFLLPTMILLEDALSHDIALLATFGRARGISLAPHGKTTMSPQIWQRQIDAGAWAITLATPWQARVAALAGVERVLIANEVVDDAGLAWLARVLADDGPEVICQVDSIAGVERMGARLGSPRRPLPVLIEVGFQGGRTGIRDIAEAIAILRAIADTTSLQAVGAAAFEGVVRGETESARRDQVRELMARVRTVGEMVGAEVRRLPLDEVILASGSSTHFLDVVDQLTEPLAADIPTRVVLRSGCTVTHDHAGFDLDSPWGSRASGNAPRLRAALEVWAPVISRPESGMAYAGAGRRDLPYDLGLPTPLKVRGLDGSMRQASGIRVARLNDQHAFLALDSDTPLAVGEDIGLGIAHPCSAFDRWRFIPLVNETYDVIDIYETIF